MNELIISALATFGVASLVSNYDGPYHVFAKLRSKYELFRCTVCLATWLATPLFFLATNGFLAYVTSLAIIGVVVIIERLT
jgi:hypothetical protein